MERPPLFPAREDLLQEAYQVGMANFKKDAENCARQMKDHASSGLMSVEITVRNGLVGRELELALRAEGYTCVLDMSKKEKQLFIRW